MKQLLLILFLLVLPACYTSRLYGVDPPDSTDDSFAETLLDHNLLIRNPMAGVFNIQLSGGVAIPIIMPVPYEWVGSGVYLVIDGLPYILTVFHAEEFFDTFQGFQDVVCHLVPGEEEPECVSVDWSNCRSDPDHDLLLVPLADFLISAEPADFRVEPELRHGQEVWVAGNPAAVPNMVSRGIVRGFGADDDRVYMTAAGTYGSSGSGVYDTDGILIGIFHGMKAVVNPINGETMPAEGMEIFYPIVGRLAEFMTD